jgi:hypothetical protein
MAALSKIRFVFILSPLNSGQLYRPCKHKGVYVCLVGGATTDGSELPAYSRIGSGIGSRASNTYTNPSGAKSAKYLSSSFLYLLVCHAGELICVHSEL